MAAPDPRPSLSVQCAWCGRVRPSGGCFDGPRDQRRLRPELSHGICPACLRRELQAVEETNPLP